MMDTPGPVESPPVDTITILICLFALILLGFLLGVLTERHLL